MLCSRFTLESAQIAGQRPDSDVMRADLRVVAIVDDDVSVREALLGLLESFSVTTHVFNDAFELMHSGVATRVGCLLLDLSMPGMSGLELHRLLVLAGASPPCILMSSAITPETRAKARAQGIQEILEKPFSLAEVLAMLSRYIHLS